MYKRQILTNAGLLDVFYIGVKAGIYPSIIFMGVGAMTDFGPLIADPKSLLLGAAAQLGVFVAFFGAIPVSYTHLRGRRDPLSRDGEVLRRALPRRKQLVP